MIPVGYVTILYSGVEHNVNTSTNRGHVRDNPVTSTDRTRVSKLKIWNRTRDYCFGETISVFSEGFEYVYITGRTVHFFVFSGHKKAKGKNARLVKNIKKKLYVCVHRKEKKPFRSPFPEHIIIIIYYTFKITI